jgi:predicted exporter
MTLRARSALFLAVLALAAAIFAAALWRGIPLQTNVLAMLPATERDPVAEKVVAALSRAIGSRVIVLVSHAEETKAKAAAERFVAEAGAAGGFRGLTARLPDADPRVLHKLYAPNRFGLLADADRDALASGSWRVRDSALHQLVSPVGGAAGLPLAQDPFGFFGRWMASLISSAGAMRLEDGYLLTRDGGRTRVLVLGEVNGDVYDNAVQSRAVAAYERGAKAALAAEPGVEVLRTGTVFFAASGRAASMRDMDRIAIGSILGVTLLMLAAFRSLRPIVLGLLSAGAGILAATLALLLVDGEVHLVTLAFGASLIGEAIDYARRSRWRWRRVSLPMRCSVCFPFPASRRSRASRWSASRSPISACNGCCPACSSSPHAATRRRPPPGRRACSRAGARYCAGGARS